MHSGDSCGDGDSGGTGDVVRGAACMMMMAVLVVSLAH